MFRDGTLFVVGAGASKEVGLPLGEELIQDISTDLDFQFNAGHLRSGDSDFHEITCSYAQERDHQLQFISAARRIARGVTFANSIDQYLDAHTNDTVMNRCGKAAIVYQVLKAEHRSLMAQERPGAPPNLAAVRGTWYEPFARLLFQGRRVDDVEAVFNGISVICFNYDRCLERFLPEALRHHFHISKTDAQNLAVELDIIHPYGTLGPLSGYGRVPFGAAPLRSNVFGISEGVRTFTEQVADDGELEKLRCAVANAETIVFLGFGFLRDNMRLLQPARKTKIKRVFATALGQSEDDRDAIHRDIYALLNPDQSEQITQTKFNAIKVRDLTCRDLFKEYWRSLQPV